MIFEDFEEIFEQKKSQDLDTGPWLGNLPTSKEPNDCLGLLNESKNLIKFSWSKWFHGVLFLKPPIVYFFNALIQKHTDIELQEFQ